MASIEKAARCKAGRAGAPLLTLVSMLGAAGQMITDGESNRLMASERSSADSRN